MNPGELLFSSAGASGQSFSPHTAPIQKVTPPPVPFTDTASSAKLVNPPPVSNLHTTGGFTTNTNASQSDASNSGQLPPVVNPQVGIVSMQAPFEPEQDVWAETNNLQHILQGDGTDQNGNIIPVTVDPRVVVSPITASRCLCSSATSSTRCAWTSM